MDTTLTVHMENTEGNGGPQADGGGEREVPGINRKLKKKYIYPQMAHMDTDGCPQANFVGELLLTNDEGLFASSSSCASS